jgi:hypothetical protein
VTQLFFADSRGIVAAALDGTNSDKIGYAFDD